MITTNQASPSSSSSLPFVSFSTHCKLQLLVDLYKSRKELCKYKERRRDLESAIARAELTI
ncbi:hypothetical protein CARUB_v10018882mg, partial [Capsella rubella]